MDRPELCDAVVGAEGFYCAFLRDGFSRGRKISLLHESAGWPEVLEWRRIPRDCSARKGRGMAANTTRLFCTKRSFSPCTFATRRETRLSPRTMEWNMSPLKAPTM